jgi:P-type Ca2+ transporter type 2C
VALTVLTSIHSPNEESVLNAIQLLWLNLIMDTLAALALATDPPSRKLLDRRPDRKSDPLITLRMWKLIIGEAIYQFTAITVLYFICRSHWMINKQLQDMIRKVVHSDVAKQMKQAKQSTASKGSTLIEFAAIASGQTVTLPAGNHQLSLNTKVVLRDALKVVHTRTGTLVFNTFVWMQIFNESNNRRLDNHLNIFEGVFRNPYFIGITVFMVIAQVLIINFAGKAFGIVRLGPIDWAISLLVGLGVFPVAVACRRMPDAWAARLLPLRRWRRRLAPELYEPRSRSDRNGKGSSDSDVSELQDLPPPVDLGKKAKTEPRDIENSVENTSDRVGAHGRNDGKE